MLIIMFPLNLQILVTQWIEERLYFQTSLNISLYQRHVWECYIIFLTSDHASVVTRECVFGVDGSMVWWHLLQKSIVWFSKTDASQTAVNCWGAELSSSLLTFLSKGISEVTKGSCSFDTYFWYSHTNSLHMTWWLTYSEILQDTERDTRVQHHKGVTTTMLTAIIRAKHYIIGWYCIMFRWALQRAWVAEVTIIPIPFHSLISQDQELALTVKIVLLHGFYSTSCF